MENIDETSVDISVIPDVDWTGGYVSVASQESVDLINQRLAILEPQIQWLCQSMEYLTKMLSGVQKAAAMMNGPMGKTIQKFMPKGPVG